MVSVAVNISNISGLSLSVRIKELVPISGLILWGSPNSSQEQSGHSKALLRWHYCAELER